MSGPTRKAKHTFTSTSSFTFNLGAQAYDVIQVILVSSTTPDAGDKLEILALDEDGDECGLEDELTLLSEYSTTLGAYKNVRQYTAKTPKLKLSYTKGAAVNLTVKVKTFSEGNLDADTWKTYSASPAGATSMTLKD